ncbi:hypothetical protein AFM11_14255 [Mycolicibacterium wolinskyi]|uniref:Uncharacterized protein n=1 Tax=Mycolicibacterium wolinskyi TaxID=59750 RepID=A0A132PM82_9MYCO|nr:hypothetical protein [Mycolicibacterium wolinskyi]KWX23446.1 hypothetical protein AFM11_14255 [Mycolicibacterium wolinskyi]
MADQIKVAAEELTKRATWISEQAGRWPTEAPKASPPDDLSSTKTAVDNLNAYGESLQKFTDVSKEESLRLARTLEKVAKAYSDVDENWVDPIERGTKAEAIPVPAPEPELPLPPEPPKPEMVSADGYLSVEETEERLNSGDAGSLNDAIEAGFKGMIAVTSLAPEASFADWEGDAADAAFAKFNKFRDWLQDLSDAWESYAGAAVAIKNAHDKAVADHKPIAEAYKALQDTLDDALEGTNPNQADIDALVAKMEAEQEKSRMVRETYASSSDPEMAKVPTPPFGVAAGGGPPNNGGQPPGTGGGGGGGTPGGQPPGGMPPGQPAMSPASANPAGGQPESAGAGGSPAGGGSPSGGGQGQGSGGGGGAPSGAGAPTGAELPSGSGDIPGLAEPSLKPASAGGGGGSGGGAGGGGGGMPSAPLGPAVGAETVAPPGGGAARGGAGMPAGAGPAGGGMAGAGMGGMGGMGHGAGGGNQGKDKRRDPNLTPDEDLYTEDRAYTEAIIGLQERRKREMQARKDPS